MTTADEKAWGDFWSQQRARDEADNLPDGWRGIEATQRETWRGLAAALPDACRLLDLATGDGRVMGWLRDVRADLEAIWVDLAPQLPPAPPGTASLSSIAIEKLPFEDNTFAVVVSQFGFEYSEIERTAVEMARVLNPGGTAALLTHRYDGAILAHNWDRRIQIGWLFERKNLFATARALLASRGSGFAVPPMAIGQLVRESAQRFGPGSVAWEIAETVCRALMLPGTADADQLAELLSRIEAQAENELGRIRSLERACRVAADEARILGALAGVGFTLIEQRLLVTADTGKPFADFRILRLAD